MAIGCFLAVGLSMFGQTNKKIGYANLSELRAEMPAFDSATVALEKLKQPVEEELLRTHNLLDQIAKQLDHEEDPEDRQKLREEHQVVTSIYAEQKEQAEETIRRIRDSLFVNIDTKINAAIDKLKRTQGFDYIYDSSKSNLPGMLGAEDVTAVLREYLAL